LRREVRLALIVSWKWGRETESAAEVRHLSREWGGEKNSGRRRRGGDIEQKQKKGMIEE